MMLCHRNILSRPEWKLEPLSLTLQTTKQNLGFFIEILIIISVVMKKLFFFLKAQTYVAIEQTQ